MTNAFEYGDTLLPQAEDGTPVEIGSNQPYLNLTTYDDDPLMAPARTDPRLVLRFSMVVLADDILESFFEADLCICPATAPS
jgi:hypothetical protein